MEEEASGRRHQGEGIREEASLEKHRGGGIIEEASGRRCQRGGSREEEVSHRKASSRRRQHAEGMMGWYRGGGIMDGASRGREASWRSHPGGIWKTSGMHLGSIWDASGVQLGDIWGTPGVLWEGSGVRLGALERSGVSWDVSAHKCAPLSVRFEGMCHHVI